jgi:hypothetical protein
MTEKQVVLFIKSSLDLIPDQVTTRAELYSAYVKWWCKSGGDKRLVALGVENEMVEDVGVASIVNFEEMMDVNGFVKRRRDGEIVWTNIALKT